MIGSFFAVLTAVTFAFNAIFIRRAVLNVSDASLGTLVTIPIAVLFFFLALAVTGQMQTIFSFSWQGYFWLSLAGIINFVAGRSLYYKCVQLVGANIANILRRVNILISVVTGISILHEPLSWQLAIGVLLIMTGITLAGLNPHTFQNTGGRFSKIPAKAFVFGFGNGVAWGLGPIFIKLGLAGSGHPIAGAFISFLAATAALSVSLMNHRKKITISNLTGKAAGLFFIGGMLSSFANLFRFIALSMAPASVVAPIVSMSPVFLLFFSFLFNRNLEVFSKPVIIGTVIIIAGTILLV